LVSYIKKDLVKEITIWIKYLQYNILLILGALAIITGIIFYINPIPPKQAFLATGQMGSSYQLLSNQFDQFFSGRGIDLTLVDTISLNEGLEKLRDTKSPVNAAFVTSGSANQKNFPDLVSLGSIQYSPIWVFYRGSEVNKDNPIDYFGKLRISIGMPNTTTQNIFLHLANDSQFKGVKPPNFFEYSNTEAADKLLAGDLDAVFIVDGILSPSVQKLINSKEIRIYDFSMADAYEKKFPFLTKLVIPKGSLDIEKIVPKNDIRLIAPSVMLLVEKEMHPVMQWSFMLAAKEFGQLQSNFFSKPGFFPRYMDESFELSPIAKRYYDSGIPLVFQYFPLWLASLIDEVWFYIISLIAVIYPLKKLFFNFREIPSGEYIEDWYQELHELEFTYRNTNDLLQLQANLNQLNSLENEIASTWIESSKLGNSYTLRNSVARIKNENSKKIEALKNSIASPS
jgi:TRAP-type uncharacterized transport system substrate-binding protein